MPWGTFWGPPPLAAVSVLWAAGGFLLPSSALQGNRCLPHRPLRVLLCLWHNLSPGAHRPWSCWGFTLVKRCPASVVGEGKERTERKKLYLKKKKSFLKWHGSVCLAAPLLASVIEQQLSRTSLQLLRWLWTTAAFLCPSLPGAGWARPDLAPSAFPKALQWGLQWVRLSCHCHFVWQGFAAWGLWMPTEGGGFSKGTWGKWTLLSLGLNSLYHLQLPWKSLRSLPDENGGNPELPQAGRWSQAETPRLGTSAPVPALTQSCHTPQVQYEFSCSKNSLHEAADSEWASSWPAGKSLQPSKASRMWSGVWFLREMGLQLSHLKHFDYFEFNYKLPQWVLQK